MKYRYCSRNLHQEPERYHFSKTGNGSFIASFLKLRKLRVDQLLVLCRSMTAPSKLVESTALPLLYSNEPCLRELLLLADYPPGDDATCQNVSKDIENSLNVKFALDGILRNQLKGRIKPEEENLLDQLARKFEVSRRIYAHYDADFRKQESSCDDMIVYALLAINLLIRFSAANNFKFLNAALKINDVLVSQEAPSSFECLVLFIACSVLESSLVSTLCQQQGLQLT